MWLDTMKLDRERLLMSLSKTEGESEEATTGRTTEDSGRQTMHIAGEDQLPAKVANVSREELRRYVQCKRVGNYLLGKTVGEGSFAKVKEALHILTGEKVAIKIIDKNRARKDRYVAKNMRREARLLQMIRHPHIVQLLEIVETSQFYYLVFEFADGGDLMDHICKRKKLEEEEVRKFIRQIISAVEYLHRLGIIHRDLKVENLLLDANRNIKIIDFGLSNTIHSTDPKNENHCSTQCGSPAYAAPELLVRKDYGSQIDVWSIGVNLYAMLTGRLPYTVEPFNISTLYNKMLKRQMNVIPDYLSEGCKDFIHQLLNPNPKERINLLDAARHRWITNDQKDPLQLIPCPNYLREEDLEDQILDHVENRLKLNSDEVIRDVIQNRSTKNSCVYHLLVRRLDRYKRDYRDVITSVPRPSTGEKNHISQPTSPPSTNCNVSLQQNSIQEPRSQPKTHIVENPFKTIRVALIRQRKATNKVDKSVATTKPETPKEGSSSHNDRTPAPKLCSVKRVALVKVAPARRSFRGVLSSARNLTSSPMPSRRKNYFEGLQQRRKSPKVRRRRTEIDDSLSSVESNSRQRNTVHSKKATQGFVRRHSEDKPMNESALNSDKNSKKSEYDAQDVYCGKAQGENKLYSEPKFEETRKSLDTVTHFYTDQGVVLKRDPIGKTDNAESNTNSIGDKDHVQCHIFHSHRQETTECAVDRQELRGSDGGSVKNANEKTGDLGKRGRVVNGDISTIQARRGVERLEHINPRPSSGGVASHCSTNKYPQEKPLTPKRTSSKPLTPSKIPVPVGRTCKSAQSPSRLSPNTPSPSTTNPRTVAKNGQVTKLTDKYAKCFSVVVVKSPGKVNESDCTTKPGVSDKNLSSKKESSVGKSKGNQAVAATTSRRINNATVSRKNQVPPKPLTKENPTKCIPRVTNSLTAKHVKKFDEKSNTSQNGVLPRTSKPSRENQTAKAKESIERTQSWSGDERRKISNYRKVTESEHIKGTTRRDIRTAPTNYKIPTSRPCS